MKTPDETDVAVALDNLAAAHHALLQAEKQLESITTAVSGTSATVRAHMARTAIRLARGNVGTASTALLHDPEEAPDALREQPRGEAP